jgi:hypothetical protein
LNDIVARALKKDPNERYNTASDMAADLRLVKMMLDLPLSANPTAAFDVTMRPQQQLHATAPITRLSQTTSPGQTPGITPPTSTVFQPKKSNTGLFVGIGAGVVALGVAAFFVFGGKGGDTPSTTPTPTTAAATPPAPTVAPAKTKAPAAPTPVAGAAKSDKEPRPRQPVHLTISGPYPFELTRAGKVISPMAAYHDVTIPPGSEPVIAHNAEYILSEAVTVDFQKPDATATIKPAGVLAVFASLETCSILVDGQDVGFPPIPRKNIAAGSHTVTMKCKDGKEDSRKIVIAPGERFPVTFGK